MDVKAKLLEELSSVGHTLSTRGLCNKLFLEKTEKYIIIPGTHRMKEVYYHLTTLRKEGKVQCVATGFWKLNKNSQ